MPVLADYVVVGYHEVMDYMYPWFSKNIEPTIIDIHYREILKVNVVVDTLLVVDTSNFKSQSRL